MGRMIGQRKQECSLTFLIPLEVADLHICSIPTSQPCCIASELSHEHKSTAEPKEPMLDGSVVDVSPHVYSTHI